MTTRDEILAEAAGDVDRALDLACAYYDVSRGHISAGFIRANTSHLAWTPKPVPDASTSDDWIDQKREKPE
jgi:hypothetical protein